MIYYAVKYWMMYTMLFQMFIVTQQDFEYDANFGIDS